MNFFNFKILLILSLISIGLVVSLPHIYGIFKFQNNYSPLTTDQSLSCMHEETYIYSAYVQELQKGNIRGDNYVWEYKNSPSVFFGEIGGVLPIYALSLIGGSIPAGFILSDFVLPIIFAMVIYFGLRQSGYEKIFSLASSIIVIIAPFLSSLLPFVSKSGTELTGAANNPLFFARTPYPQITSIFLFSIIFVTAELLRRFRKNIIYLWSVLLGMTFYLMPYIGSVVLLSSLFF